MISQTILSIFTIKKMTRLMLILVIISIGHFLAYKIVHVPAQLEMVIIISVLIFYPIIRNPQIGIVLLFLIMPFVPYLRRLYYLQYIRPSVDPLIVLGDIIIAFMIIGLFFEFKDRKMSTEKSTKFVQVILLYFIYLLFRTFVFNILPPSVTILKFRLYGPSALLFLIGTLFAYNRRIIVSILYLTVAVGVIAAFYGMWQLFFGYSKAEKLWFSSISFTTLFIKGFARPFSIFQAPAAFADFMQLSVIGVIILIGTLKKIHLKLILILLLPIFFYGALITSVRSNWIGILVSLMLWIVYMQLKTNKTRVIVLIAISLIFSISQILDFNPMNGFASLISISNQSVNSQNINLLISERASALINPFEEHSLMSRLMLWKLIINLSFDPFMGLVGRGIGALNADSLYFTYLAELGYPGLIFIVSITFFFIARGFSLIDKSEGFLQGLAKGITIMNITFAIINITGTHIHSFPGDVYYWFFNGVLLKLEAVVRKNGTPEYYENTGNN